MDMRTLQQIVQAGFADNALAGQLHCSFRQGVGGRQPCSRQPLSLSIHARLLFLHSGQALAWIRGECGTEGLGFREAAALRVQFKQARSDLWWTAVSKAR